MAQPEGDADPETAATRHSSIGALLRVEIGLGGWVPVAARGGLPHRSLDGMGGCPLPRAEACSVGRRGPAGGDVAVVAAAASFFIFIFFKNIFL